MFGTLMHPSRFAEYPMERIHTHVPWSPRTCARALLHAVLKRISLAVDENRALRRERDTLLQNLEAERRKADMFEKLANVRTLTLCCSFQTDAVLPRTFL
jgi:hypothetical protein